MNALTKSMLLKGNAFFDLPLNLFFPSPILFEEEDMLTKTQLLLTLLGYTGWIHSSSLTF